MGLYAGALREMAEAPTLIEALFGDEPLLQQGPQKMLDVDHEMLAGPTATVCRVSITIPSDRADAPNPVLSATGEARRAPHDENNWKVGHLLALGRALQAAGRLVESQGDFEDRMSRPVTVKFRLHSNPAEPSDIPVAATVEHAEDCEWPAGECRCQDD